MVLEDEAALEGDPVLDRAGPRREPLEGPLRPDEVRVHRGRDAPVADRVADPRDLRGSSTKMVCK